MILLLLTLSMPSRSLHTHYVEANGDIVGVIGRADMEKPVVRMWLFGLIMLIEVVVAQAIRKLSPNESWTALVSESRLEKARQLQEERVRRKLPAELLDCLQFSDKLQIVVCSPQFVKQAGFLSAILAEPHQSRLSVL